MAKFTVETSSHGYYYRTYEVEAENEEDAKSEVEDGNGILIVADASDLDSEDVLSITPLYE